MALKLNLPLDTNYSFPNAVFSNSFSIKVPLRWAFDPNDTTLDWVAFLFFLTLSLLFLGTFLIFKWRESMNIIEFMKFSFSILYRSLFTIVYKYACMNVYILMSE